MAIGLYVYIVALQCQYVMRKLQTKYIGSEKLCIKPGCVAHTDNEFPFCAWSSFGLIYVVVHQCLTSMQHIHHKSHTGHSPATQCSDRYSEYLYWMHTSAGQQCKIDLQAARTYVAGSNVGLLCSFAPLYVTLVWLVHSRIGSPGFQLASNVQFGML